MTNTKINNVRVTGELVEVDTLVRTTDDGRNYVNGKVVIKTDVNGSEQLVEAKVLAFELKKDGTVNKQFTSFKSLETMLNKRVTIFGKLADDSMVKDEKVIHFNSIMLSVINTAKVDAPNESAFEFSGFVVKELYERVNKDEQVYGYRIEIGQSYYNGDNMSVIRLDVDKDDKNIIAAIQDNYVLGSTVKVNGSIYYNTRIETVTEQVSFGEPVVKSFTRSEKNFRITSGNEPNEEVYDEGRGKKGCAYSDEDIKKLVAAYKKADADKLEAAKTVAEEPAQTSAAAGMKNLTRANGLL